MEPTTVETAAPETASQTGQSETSQATPNVDVPMQRATKGKPKVSAGSGAGLDAMAQAAASLKAINAENARLQGVLKTTQAENAKLRGLVSSDAEPKLPITDAQLRKACDVLIEATRNNPAKPQRSLKAQFVVIDGAAVWVGDNPDAASAEGAVHVVPELGDNDANGKGQKATWKAARKEIDRMHTVWTKTEAPKLINTVKFALKKPEAIASGAYITRTVKTAKGEKVAKRIGARISAKEGPVKTPGRGKGAAKPTVS